MGSSVSPEQVALLRERGVRFLTLLLDGDDAGRRARERVLPDLASSVFVRAPLLPDGQKPDTLPEAELPRARPFPLARRRAGHPSRVAFFLRGAALDSWILSTL